MCVTVLFLDEIQKFMEEVKSLGYNEKPKYEALACILKAGLKAIRAKDDGKLEFTPPTGATSPAKVPLPSRPPLCAPSRRLRPSHARRSVSRRPPNGRRPTPKTRAASKTIPSRRKPEVELGRATPASFFSCIKAFCAKVGADDVSNQSDLSSGEANRGRKEPKKPSRAGNLRSRKEEGASSGLKLLVETSTQTSPEPAKPSRGRTKKSRS